MTSNVFLDDCVFTVRKRSCGKVKFLHLSFSHSVHRGACVARGRVWQGGTCMAGGNGGEGHAWQGEGMCDRGGVHGRRQE